MHSLEDIIRAKRRGINFGYLAELHRIRKSWRDIVGPALFKQTFVHSLRHGVLYLVTENSVWLSELDFLKERLTERVYKYSKVRIKDINVRVAKVSQALQGSQNFDEVTQAPSRSSQLMPDKMQQAVDNLPGDLQESMRSLWQVKQSK